MNTPLTFVIADDHPLFRKGLKDIIETDEHFKIICDVGDGEQAMMFIENHTPDFAILDINMPKFSGLQIAEEIRNKNLRTQVILLTMYDQEDTFNHAMDVGIIGYVLKDSASTEILDCIEAISNNEVHVSKPLMKYFLRRSARLIKKEKEASGLHSLTPAEKNVLQFIANGKTTNEIARDLFVSVKTIENHRANICEKLNVHGTNALLKFAIEHRALL